MAIMVKIIILIIITIIIISKDKKSTLIAKIRKTIRTNWAKCSFNRDYWFFLQFSDER